MSEPEVVSNPKKPNSNNRPEFVSSLFDIMEVVVFAVVIAILMLTLIVRTGYVDGTSMEETMHQNDRYILSNLFYTPKQGDILVFAPDKTQQVGEQKLWVKRVIATAGQKVYINPDDNSVYVDDVKLEEAYIDQPTVLKANMRQENPVVVPEGYIYVLGDNRGVSIDSRTIGCVDTRRIIGHVLFRVYPFNKIGPVK